MTDQTIFSSLNLCLCVCDVFCAAEQVWTQKHWQDSRETQLCKWQLHTVCMLGAKKVKCFPRSHCTDSKKSRDT